MKRVLIGLAGLLMAAASPAAADWQFTKWGMSQAEVKAAGAGKVVDGYEAPSRWNLKIDGPYVVAGIKFKTVLFGFTEGRLNEIELTGRSEDAQSTVFQLSKAVGEPSLVSGGYLTMRTYRDVPNGNAIKMVYGDSDMTLTYSPISNGF